MTSIVNSSSRPASSAARSAASSTSSGVAEDGVQQAARILRRAAGYPLGRGQLALPAGDLLAGERVQRPLAPVRPDEPADPVLAVRRSAGADIVQGLPAVDPVADRDLARPWIGPRAGADLRLLVAAPAERGLLRLKARLAGLPAGNFVLYAPRSGSLAAFLRVRHVSPGHLLIDRPLA